jgi:hypothetical protein
MERRGGSRASPPGGGEVPYARLISGLRLLAIVLAGLWVALAVAVLVAYHPGGPFDLLVRAAVFVPVVIAGMAVVYPPIGHDQREAAAIGWLGLIDVLLLIPLLAGVLQTLQNEASQSLLPSAEVAYAAVLTMALTCIFTALGVIQRHQRAVDTRRTWVIESLLLASALTLLATLVLGIPSLANELALVNRPATASRFGPTDASLPLPHCDVPPPIGGKAVLEGDATAMVDAQSVGEASLSGTRSGSTQEQWQARLNGTFASGAASLDRKAMTAQVNDADGLRTLDPRDLGMADAGGLTLDGAIAAYLATGDVGRVAEDRGVELVENAPARHCRVTLDGPGALATSMLTRLLIDGTVDPHPNLDAWRGSLEWWVFADDELGQAVVTIGGYPGDAWASSGLQATIVARMSATNRSGSAIIPSVSSSPSPVQSPIASPSTVTPPPTAPASTP